MLAYSEIPRCSLKKKLVHTLSPTPNREIWKEEREWMNNKWCDREMYREIKRDNIWKCNRKENEMWTYYFFNLMWFWDLTQF